MLARFEEAGGLAVEADHSGRFLRVRPPARAAQVVARLAERGVRVEPLSTDEARRAIASARGWYGCEGLRRLARVEFAAIARRWAARLRAETALTEREERWLVSLLEREWDAAAASLPGAEGPPHDTPAWRRARVEAIRRLLAELATRLPPARLAIVRSRLEAALEE